MNRLLAAGSALLLALAAAAGCVTRVAPGPAPEPEPLLDAMPFDLARECPGAAPVHVLPADPTTPRLWPSNFWSGAAGGATLASLGVFVAYAAPMFQGAAAGALLLPFLVWEGHENDACARTLESVIERSRLPSRLEENISRRLRRRAGKSASPCEVRVEMEAYGFVADPPPGRGRSAPSQASGPASRYERFALGFEGTLRVLRQGREIHRDRIVWGPTSRSRDLPPPFRAPLSAFCRDGGAEAERRLIEASVILAAAADSRLGD